MTTTKRPKGLKNSASKKQKVAETEDEIIVEITSQNDLEELSHLYNQALEHQNENQVEQAKMLFRGVVHECDKMVRIRNGEVPNASEEEMELLKKSVEALPVLPGTFYVVYANALYYLALIDSDKPLEFLEMANEKAEIAIEKNETPEALHSLGRILIQQAELGSVQALSKFKETMAKLIAIAAQKESILKLINELCQYCHNYLDNLERIEEKKEWIAYNNSNWSKVLEVDRENMDALIGLGNSHLCFADELIQVYEGEGMDEAMTTKIKDFLLKSLSSFQKVLKGLKPDESPVRIRLLLGECQVNLGNILDNDDPDAEDNEEAMKYYKAAVESFEIVEKLDSDALPEQFKDFLNEWKADF